MSKNIFVTFIILSLFLVTNGQVIAQSASPSASPTASASPAPSPSPSASPTPAASASPSPTASSGTGGVTATPTPSASASGEVLGGTTKLAETSSIKLWVMYALSGSVILGVILYGLKLVRANHVEE